MFPYLIKLLSTVPFLYYAYTSFETIFGCCAVLPALLSIVASLAGEAIAIPRAGQWVPVWFYSAVGLEPQERLHHVSCDTFIVWLDTQPALKNI